jgi:predicted branched-subunit amino acid permease
MVRTELRAGSMAIVPMLIGVIPFGLVAGVTPVAGGLGGGAAVGFSTIVFAGASQLAAIEVLSDGGAAVVAALAACTINLRMLLYSASLAPYLSSERFGRRMAVAYLLTDQAYAVSILRWRGERGPDPEPSVIDRSLLDRRWSFYLGAGLTLWGAWQASTVAGALLGNAIPDSVPLGFAVPLVFLVLLIPTLDRAHAVVAAVVGGLATVVALELGVGPLSVMVGAVAGVLAGALADRDDQADPVAAT